MRSLYARLADRYAPERGMDRREMIRRSLTAAAGILLSERLAPTFGRSARATSNHPFCWPGGG
jgi:hypothetical protein